MAATLAVITVWKPPLANKTAMWVWGILFDLGRDVGRYAMRGIGCLFMLGFALSLLGGFATYLVVENQGPAAALVAAPVNDYRGIHARLQTNATEFQRSDDVAAEWKREREAEEAHEAARSAYIDMYED